jgi:hypothetical protein
MRFRKLRIAWSVGWGIACVLLVVLWVRSYWWCDQICKDISPALYTLCYSTEGEIELYWYPDPNEVSKNGTGWQVFHVPGEDWSRLNGYMTALDRVNGGFPTRNFEFTKHGLKIPIWFLSLVAAASAAVPWLSWRYSLRTLLIATTLVAVVLGTIAWLAH